MITAAAIKHDGIVYTLPPPARHHTLIRHIHYLTGVDPVIGVQGFVNDRGTFLTRHQAAKEAVNSGQIPVDHIHATHLYSEDLW